jgi:hypothetical protein
LCGTLLFSETPDAIPKATLRRIEPLPPHGEEKALTLWAPLQLGKVYPAEEVSDTEKHRINELLTARRVLRGVCDSKPLVGEI